MTLGNGNHWDSIFAAHAVYGTTTPHALVVKFATMLMDDDQRQVIDLGCGRGRHSLYLASKGFTVLAVDIARSALQALKQEAEQQGLSLNIKIINANISELDVQTRAAIAIGVLNHGSLDDAQRNLNSFVDILLPGGIAAITLPSSNDARALLTLPSACGVLCVKLQTGPEKGIPHCFFSEDWLLSWTKSKNLDILSLEEDITRATPRLAHWNIIFSKAEMK
ncbi:hypothetical protein LCGC14_1916720 [marine sediment metagenome]|uniref:Methyltransferase domain-containing protein n=1 Tax=marine sediment metagenome TaxID=412755 RepID=A0A0F9FRS8_9ZZZZ